MTTKVGGEVDTFCGRCKLVLAHTVLAMVGTRIARVRCNTCGSDHAYRPDAAKVTSRERTRHPRVSFSYTDRLATADPARAIAYDPKLRYTVDQLIRHPSFGLGFVTAIREDKMEVAFKTFSKTLIHARNVPSPSQ